MDGVEEEERVPECDSDDDSRPANCYAITPGQGGTRSDRQEIGITNTLKNFIRATQTPENNVLRTISVVMVNLNAPTKNRN